MTQITLYDYYMENLSHAARCRRDGYINIYDSMPEREGAVEVIDHEGHRFTSQAVRSFGSMALKGDRGYGICWWRYKT